MILRQRGFSLIEVMVALLVALFLLAALGSLVSGTRRTSTNQTSLAQLQDEERLAMSVLNDVLQSAGYYDANPNDTTFQSSAVAAFPAVAVNGESLAAGQFLGGVHTSNAVPDSLVVQYRSNGSDQVINCAGQTTTSTTAAPFVNYFFVGTGENANQLQCSPDGLTTDAVTLVTGVVNFQIWYGITTTTANSADTYETANNVTNWGNVISARITLVFNNPLYSQPGQPQYVTFTRVISLQAKGGPAQAST